MKADNLKPFAEQRFLQKNAKANLPERKQRIKKRKLRIAVF